MTEPITVTTHNPATGETNTEQVAPDGYIAVVGERMHITAVQRYRTGTIQVTIKPKTQP